MQFNESLLDFFRAISHFTRPLLYFSTSKSYSNHKRYNFLLVTRPPIPHPNQNTAHVRKLFGTKCRENRDSQLFQQFPCDLHPQLGWTETNAYLSVFKSSVESVPWDEYFSTMRTLRDCRKFSITSSPCL